MFLQTRSPYLYFDNPRLQNRPQPQSPESLTPPVDVARQGDDIILFVELPGVELSAVSVEVEGRTLFLSAEKLRPTAEGLEHLKSERSFGRVTRSFTLPNHIDPSAIEATFKCGVLEVRLPRAEETKPRKIEIAG